MHCSPHISLCIPRFTDLVSSSDHSVESRKRRKIFTIQIHEGWTGFCILQEVSGINSISHLLTNCRITRQDHTDCTIIFRYIGDWRERIRLIIATPSKNSKQNYQGESNQKKRNDLFHWN